jgi:hypothetical protein
VIRLYALGAAVVAFLLLAATAYAMYERGNAALAREQALGEVLAQTRADLAAERAAAVRSAALASQQAAAAAAARARADAIERTSRDMIERFRAEEVEPEHDTETVETVHAPVPPRANCVCGFSAADRDRLLQDIPIRRPAPRSDPGAGLGSVDPVPRSGGGSQP